MKIKSLKCAGNSVGCPTSSLNVMKFGPQTA